MQRSELPMQQPVLQEHVDAVLGAQCRVLTETQYGGILAVCPAFDGIVPFPHRRSDLLRPLPSVIAELGEITRFDSPRQLVSFLEPVPGAPRDPAIGRVRSPRSATAMSAGSWWRTHGRTGSRSGRRRNCGGRRPRCRPGSRRWPEPHRTQPVQLERLRLSLRPGST